MKPLRYQLQANVLKRLSAGLPVTAWQQFCLHSFAAARQTRHLRFARLIFHARGICRAFWRPVTLFSIGTLPVQIHLTCLIYPIGFLFWLGWDEGLANAFFCVALVIIPYTISLLAHEFAHVWAARRSGIGARRIIYIPIGAVAELTDTMNARQEFWIASAGPLASAALAGVCLLCLWLHPLHRWLNFIGGVPIVRVGGLMNLWLAGFNLIPCYPMDGGRILRSGTAWILEKVFFQPEAIAFERASHFTLRYVAWLCALIMVYITILHTHEWLNFVLFPLMLLVAELEYRSLSEEQPVTHPVQPQPAPHFGE